MCGVAGELTFDGRPASADAVRAMTDALQHRGPDDAGLYCDGPIGLGHRRLAIIDLSPGGHQPMWTADGRFAVIFNGEIYNYQELARELLATGYRFQNQSDTEVLLAAVATWGVERALQRFIGMFAFALWDSRERILTLCRDRVGIKPLHYFVDGTRLLFASELKAIVVHPSFQRTVNPAAVAQFLSIGYIVAPATIYDRTYKLPAACYARVTEDGRVSLHRYWSLDQVQRGAFHGTLEDAAAELDILAESAFRYRLVSDVPVGVFLSGGTDSSYLAGVLRRRIGADLLHLTIGFHNEAFDESAKARQVAETLGVRHQVRYLDATQAQGMLERFVEVYDEPFSDTSGLPTLLVSAMAREYVKVVLSADGGDEQFSGYPSYVEYAARSDSMRMVPSMVRRALASALRALPLAAVASAWSARDASGLRPQAVARLEKGIELIGAVSVADVLQLMNEKAWPFSKVGGLMAGQPTVDPAAGTPLAFLHGDLRGHRLVDAMMRTDYAMFLADDVLTKVDRASMAASLECRDPFLDHRIAEFAFSLPLEFLTSRGEQKHILKNALRSWLAEPIVSAPKRGFMIPLYQWLRGPWRPMVERHLSAAAIERAGLLDVAATRAAVDGFYARPGLRAERIMSLLLLQMWAGRWSG